MPETKMELADRIREQARLLEDEFKGTDIVLELETKRETIELPRYHWVIRKMVDGKPIGHYALVNCCGGRSGDKELVLVNVYNQSPIEIRNETSYGRKDLKANAKAAFKRVGIIVEKADLQAAYNKARRDEELEMERLTKEELGDASDLVDSKFWNTCQEIKPINYLTRFEDGTYKVVMRTRLSLNKVRKLIALLREDD
jgi:hypothetical protein